IAVEPVSASPTCAVSSTIDSNFNGTDIAAGGYIWFNSHAKIQHQPSSGTVTIHVEARVIALDGTGLNGNPFTLPIVMPGADITLSSTVTTASTSFVGGRWVSAVPLGTNGDIFVTGLSYPLPQGLNGGANPVTMQLDFSGPAISPALGFQWQWAAAGYDAGFTTNHAALG